MRLHVDDCEFQKKTLPFVIMCTRKMCLRVYDPKLTENCTILQSHILTPPPPCDATSKAQANSAYVTDLETQRKRPGPVSEFRRLE